jgi:hypothetical protein
MVETNGKSELKEINDFYYYFYYFFFLDGGFCQHSLSNIIKLLKSSCHFRYYQV